MNSLRDDRGTERRLNRRVLPIAKPSLDLANARDVVFEFDEGALAVTPRAEGDRSGGNWRRTAAPNQASANRCAEDGRVIGRRFEASAKKAANQRRVGRSGRGKKPGAAFPDTRCHLNGAASDQLTPEHTRNGACPQFGAEDNDRMWPVQRRNTEAQLGRMVVAVVTALTAAEHRRYGPRVGRHSDRMAVRIGRSRDGLRRARCRERQAEADGARDFSNQAETDAARRHDAPE